ncbi:MAG: response regulator transcription factor [Cellulosilyticaceae bacterium]
MTYTVLVCDDDENINRSISIYLQQDGYKVLQAYDGLECLNYLKKETVHLIILDVMMPKLDGMSTLFNIRQQYNVPVIMLSAKSESTDKIAGLSFGADDYVAKPCDILELLARVKSNLRRYTKLGNIREEEQEAILIGDLCIYRKFNKVTLEGEEVRLTPTEYKILLCLMEHAGQVLSNNQIYAWAWGEEAYTVDNTVSVHIRRIREKIEINPKEPKYLKVVWGCGYKIEKVEQEDSNS